MNISGLHCFNFQTYCDHKYEQGRSTLDWWPGAIHGWSIYPDCIEGYGGGTTPLHQGNPQAPQRADLNPPFPPRSDPHHRWWKISSPRRPPATVSSTLPTTRWLWQLCTSWMERWCRTRTLQSAGSWTTAATDCCQGRRTTVCGLAIWHLRFVSQPSLPKN